MPKLVRFVVGLLIVAGVIVGVARAFAIRWWRVPDDDPYLEAAIGPTLQGGDWIILWRLTPPHLGDLVLCPEPQAPDRAVIARIAGVEGDQVEVKGSVVTRNRRRAGTEGDCRAERFTTADPQTGELVTQSCDMEELGGDLHQRGNVAAGAAVPEARVKLAAGEVFLLSDNRMFPYDSREFGPAEHASCRETVVFRVLGKSGFQDVERRLSFIR